MVIFFAATSGIKNPSIFLNSHAATIVVGGTAAAALICFPLSYFFSMIKVFLTTMTGQRRAVTLRTINEIVKVSEAVNGGRPIGEIVGKVRNPFLKEALELVERGGLSDDEIEEVLEKRVEAQNERYKRNSFTFKIIGKFPPAFGLVGTSIGMISLLQGLGEPNAFDRLGPSMSLALVATFYGLVFANFILIPVGENLGQASEDDLVMRRIVVDGVRLIKAEKHPLLVGEYLKSYISPAERMQIKLGK
jgi:chemotaxis protein MotA